MSSRSVPFRRTVSDAVSWRQDQAQNATIYILRETGPTGFLLKEEGETKTFKVFLGDPHTCTCPVYKKEKDLCKHICWILLKKFRIPRDDTESFQLGLVEREINALLRGRTHLEARQRQNQTRNKKDHHAVDITGDGREVLAQREITEEDVCPICQDEFLATREPVTYCRFGCAKSIHIRCMKVWAEHQNSTGDDTIMCPLCREDFGQIEFLQKEFRNSSLQKTQAERGVIHRGVVCSQCNQSPIAGRCYRCIECKTKYLCQECYSSNVHSQHEFQYRQKPNQRWRPAQRGSGGVLPPAVLEDLQNRELQVEDYELLLQLDSGDANKASTIPEDVVQSFPTETVREGGALTSPGVQCRVCLRGFTAGQVVRRLPCRHKFHTECIDQWLVHQHPTCPVDGTVVWNPLTANLNTADRKVKHKKRPSTQQDHQNSQLDLTGLGILSGRRIGAPLGQRRTGPAPLTNNSGGIDQVLLTAEFQLMGLGMNSQNRTSSRNSSTDEMNRDSRKVWKPLTKQNSHNSPSSTCTPSKHHSVHDVNTDLIPSTLSNHPLPVLDNHAATIFVGQGQEAGSLTSSRASWLSGDTTMNIHNTERDINSNNPTNFNHFMNFTEHDQSRKPRHKPPSGSRVGRTNIQFPHPKYSHHISIPSRSEINNLELSASRFTASNSAPSPSERGTVGRTKVQCPHPKYTHHVSIPSRSEINNLELTASRFTASNSAPILSERGTGRSPGSTPERGRRNKGGRSVNDRQRARSSSIGRKSSRHSGQPGSAKLEDTEDLFLGSPPTRTSSGRPRPGRLRDSSRRQKRSSSLPGKVEEMASIDMVLTGYRFNSE